MLNCAMVRISSQFDSFPGSSQLPGTAVARMIFLLSLILGYSSGFQITSFWPGHITVFPDEKVTLNCVVDEAYEWCKFFHPNGKFCDFEWKRSQSNITMQECQLAGKVGGLSSSAVELLIIIDILNVSGRFSFMESMMIESVGLLLLLGLRIQELGGEPN